MQQNICSQLTAFLLLLLLFSPKLAAEKKPLDHSVYDSWKSFKKIEISDDGQYAFFVVSEQEGDAELFIKQTNGTKELCIKRAASFTVLPDGKKLVAKIKPPYALTRQEKIKKTAEEKLPKDNLAIVDLQKMTVTKIGSIDNYSIGKEATKHIAYTLSDTVKSKENTNTLIIRSVESGKEDSLKNVSKFVFSKNGKALLATTKPAEKDSTAVPAVYFFDLEKNKTKKISTGSKEYLQVALSDDGSQACFLATSDSAKAIIKSYKLHYFKSADDSARLIISNSQEELPKQWVLSKTQAPYFSPNGKRLFFGLAPTQLPKDTTIPDFEKAGLDIWHWQEERIQPWQLKTAEEDKNRAYLSYINLTDKTKIKQLGNEAVPFVFTSQESDGRYALGVSQNKYLFKSQWDMDSRYTYDFWSFDLVSGERKLIKEGVACSYRFSYLGNYLVWYDLKKQNYYSYDLRTGKEHSLTAGLNVNFWNEENDMPMTPEAYGTAMWLEKDKGILVYDKYDIWNLDPSGKTRPINITGGKGRKNEITFRYLKTDKESKFIASKEDLLLTAFDNKTKKNGYYKLQNNRLIACTLDGFRYRSTQKAKKKNNYLFVKENFNNSPDLYFTTDNWKSEKRMTEINPQMKDYNWGTNELVQWTAYDGEKLEGLLYKPENFDPNKKYPMLCYFYERYSEELYQFYQPAPSRSIINIPFYVSRGYLVFVPDIHYKEGEPGESAYNCIVSGVEEISKNSWVDKENIGIQGQSWGGYQVAYLVTRTNMFKAAGSGAPVSNMFSAYGGIRWTTGRSRQYQYEQTQSRLGKTMWESPDLYRKNSPVFFADKVETPILIMHNDNDGAVPWYQGIEFFMALRRLGKPVWLLQYNNEEHNLVERRNCKDLSIRLQQFFDHYLKNESLPQWIDKGVPATEKGENYGFDFVK